MVASEMDRVSSGVRVSIPEEDARSRYSKRSTPLYGVMRSICDLGELGTLEVARM